MISLALCNAISERPSTTRYKCPLKAGNHGDRSSRASALASLRSRSLQACVSPMSLLSGLCSPVWLLPRLLLTFFMRNVIGFPQDGPNAPS